MEWTAAANCYDILGIEHFQMKWTVVVAADVAWKNFQRKTSSIAACHDFAVFPMGYSRPSSNAVVHCWMIGALLEETVVDVVATSMTTAVDTSDGMDASGQIAALVVSTRTAWDRQWKVHLAVVPALTSCWATLTSCRFHSMSQSLSWKAFFKRKKREKRKAEFATGFRSSLLPQATSSLPQVQTVAKIDACFNSSYTRKAKECFFLRLRGICTFVEPTE
jgi:hypothetical protein